MEPPCDCEHDTNAVVLRDALVARPIWGRANILAVVYPILQAELGVLLSVNVQGYARCGLSVRRKAVGCTSITSQSRSTVFHRSPHTQSRLRRNE